MDELNEQAEALLTRADEVVSGVDSGPTPRGQGACAAVTLHAEGRVVATAVGRGTDLTAAVRRAAGRAVRSAGPHAGHLTLSLWIPVGAVPLEKFDVGRDALVTRDGRLYRPSVPLTRGYTSATDAMTRLGGCVEAQHWRHFVRHGGQAVELSRLRPEPPQLNRPAVLGIVDRALDRLLAAQQPDGTYRYVDHAFARTPRQPVNLVRLAGTAYAVARAAASAATPQRRAELAHSAERAVHHLLGHLTDVEGGALLRTAQDNVPAGAAALTLLAMQYAGLDERFLPWRRQLIGGLLALQQRDGRFRGSPDSPCAQKEGAQQDYFPGEIMLALVHEAERGDGVCLAAVTHAFPAHAEYLRSRPRMATALWHCDVWWRVWRLTGGRYGGAESARYALLVRDLADHVLRRQLRTRDEFHGGFAARGRRPGISSSCYVEALVRAWQVSSGDTEARRRYGRAVRAGLRFVARLQVDPILEPMLTRPDTGIGAFTTTLQSFKLRSDHDQHAITMFLAAVEHPRLVPSDD